MARPTEISCEDCGATVKVKAKGRVPTRCDDCRTRPSATPPANDGAQVDKAATADEQPPAAADAGQTVDDGWPKRIAPLAWVDQKGRRYNDLGAARAGADACRS
jgi:hypothetical protein